MTTCKEGWFAHTEFEVVEPGNFFLPQGCALVRFQNRIYPCTIEQGEGLYYSPFWREKARRAGGDPVNCEDTQTGEFQAVCLLYHPSKYVQLAESSQRGRALIFRDL